jgi:hypothetical protein
LIAEEGGAFVFQFPGGIFHLCLEFLDECSDVYGAFLDPDTLFLVTRDEDAEALLHRAVDAARSDAVLAVMLHLASAAVLGDVKEVTNASGDLVGKEDDFAVEVSGGAAGR